MRARLKALSAGFAPAMLDLFTIAWVGGYLIAGFTGGLGDDGIFSLEGPSASLLFALIAAYFIVGRLWLGGTPWQRIFRACNRWMTKQLAMRPGPWLKVDRRSSSALWFGGDCNAGGDGGWEGGGDGGA